jgi:hypothetical protein
MVSRTLELIARARETIAHLPPPLIERQPPTAPE